MTKYRYIADAPVRVDVGGRAVYVETGDVVDIADDGRYVQTGDTGEPALFELVNPTPKKAARPQKESE